MKLSFSTRGWSDLDWPSMLENASQMRYSGIELYNITRCAELTGNDAPFGKYGLAQTLRELRERRLSIPCFDTSCDISVDSPELLDEIKNTLEIAAASRVPYVCLFAKEDEPQTIEKNLKTLVEAAHKLNTTILLKTSGVFSNTEKLRDVLNRFASDNLAVVWDVHHPYRDFGESPADSIRNLGAYVRHVHLRDSDNATTYNLVGEGSFPIREVMAALSSIDYSGFISLEWKPVWNDEIRDRDIIFPHFVNFMERFERNRGRNKMIYPNHDGSGYYIWKKNELINKTFSKVLDRVADEFPDQYCFKYTTLDYTRTYAEFRRDVDDFARALVSMGVRKGSKVAVWATNVPA